MARVGLLGQSCPRPFGAALKRVQIRSRRICRTSCRFKSFQTNIKKPTSMRWVFLYGACGRIRTSDRLVRSQVLYPAELHTRKTCCWPSLPTNNGGEGGIRTLDTRICVWFLSRELVSATHPPLLDCGVHFTDSLA